MTLGRLSKGAAALSVAAVATLGFQAPVWAQAQPGFNCPNPAGNYPPGQCRRAATDSTPAPGQEISVTSGSGSFTPGSQVTVRVLGSTFSAVADSTGNATVTFRIPSDARPGRTNVVFSSPGQADVAVPITVVAAAAANRGRADTLPRTGAGYVAELTAAGLGLVAVGGGIVVASRRRRDGVAPGSIA